MGGGKREGDEVFIEYPCGKSEYVRLFLTNSSALNGLKFMQTMHPRVTGLSHPSST